MKKFVYKLLLSFFLGLGFFSSFGVYASQIHDIDFNSGNIYDTISQNYPLQIPTSSQNYNITNNPSDFIIGADGNNYGITSRTGFFRANGLDNGNGLTFCYRGKGNSGTQAFLIFPYARIYVYNDGTHFYHFESVNGGNYFFNGDNSWNTDGNWHDFCIVGNTDDVYIYVDGNEIHHATNVGSYEYNRSDFYHQAGPTDDLKVFNHMLSASQIANVFGPPQASCKDYASGLSLPYFNSIVNETPRVDSNFCDVGEVVAPIYVGTGYIWKCYEGTGSSNQATCEFPQSTTCNTSTGYTLNDYETYIDTSGYFCDEGIPIGGFQDYDTYDNGGLVHYKKRTCGYNYNGEYFEETCRSPVADGGIVAGCKEHDNIYDGDYVDRTYNQKYENFCLGTADFVSSEETVFTGDSGIYYGYKWTCSIDDGGEVVDYTCSAPDKAPTISECMQYDSISSFDRSDWTDNGIKTDRFCRDNRDFTVATGFVFSGGQYIWTCDYSYGGTDTGSVLYGLSYSYSCSAGTGDDSVINFGVGPPAPGIFEYIFDKLSDLFHLGGIVDMLRTFVDFSYVPDDVIIFSIPTFDSNNDISFTTVNANPSQYIRDNIVRSCDLNGSCSVSIVPLDKTITYNITPFRTFLNYFLPVLFALFYIGIVIAFLNYTVLLPFNRMLAKLRGFLPIFFLEFTNNRFQTGVGSLPLTILKYTLLGSLILSVVLLFSASVVPFLAIFKGLIASILNMVLYLFGFTGVSFFYIVEIINIAFFNILLVYVVGYFFGQFKLPFGL